jgi:hypothetical protein
MMAPNNPEKTICERCAIRTCHQRGTRKYRCGYRSIYYSDQFEKLMDAQDMKNEQKGD